MEVIISPEYQPKGGQTSSASHANVETFLARDSFGDIDGKTLNSRHPILVRIGSDGKNWYAENEEFDVFASGMTREEAIANFASHITFFYSQDMNAPDENLDPSAKSMKEKLAQEFYLAD